jgi:hypothetical protein
MRDAPMQVILSIMIQQRLTDVQLVSATAVSLDICDIAKQQTGYDRNGNGRGGKETEVDKKSNSRR